MRPSPSTAECIEEMALFDPSQPAIREEEGELNYGQLNAMLLGCGRLLQDLGVRRGDRVAVGGPGFGIQLLVLLAAESLGAVTASFQAFDDPDTEFLFPRVQWVFAARPQQVPAGVQFHLLDAEFLRRLQPGPGFRRPDWAPAAPHEPQRISRTSGSSGRSKFMVLTRQAQDHWMASGREKLTYGPGTRLLVLGPLVMNAALSRTSVCLRRGALVMAGDKLDLPRLRPTHVWGLPIQLERLLQSVPPDYVSPHPVQVSTVGGVVPPELRAAVARVFLAPLKNRYGSNEVGSICEDLDRDGVGALSAGVDARILDEDGAILPLGQPGRIALRTPATVDGYLDRPEESAAVFRDGWFVSGDAGLLLSERRLRLLGRHDDLVNLGGIKVPCTAVEADLRVLPALAEVAVLAVHLADGAVSLGIAVVLAPGASREEASAQVSAALRTAASTTARLLFLPALPRLRNDKLDRMRLLQLLHQ
jgi:acyl-coenzyme A synthetase/AMP-(fatty) acid ligase